MAIREKNKFCGVMGVVGVGSVCLGVIQGAQENHRNTDVLYTLVTLVMCTNISL